MLRSQHFLVGATSGLLQFWGQFMLGRYTRGYFVVGMALNFAAMLLYIGGTLMMLESASPGGMRKATARKAVKMQGGMALGGLVAAFGAVALLEGSYLLLLGVLTVYTLLLPLLLPSTIRTSTLRRIFGMEQDTWSA
eukprot:TRINITY_DN14036_c0_g1_i2.p1 TRINITY_DN14036_c0_g1~~TRINITY_DN14036_c0_g1_i2.p1  ORF type:complete len:137 (+),score=48.88 TRINITY_DN14036_c0_g1_i2:185-595(+)